MALKAKAKTPEGKQEKKEIKEQEHRQPEISIGLVGHVDHGKTTITERFSGKWTDTHSEEVKRGITIRLGYANASFYKCEKCKASQAYGTTEKCANCEGKAKLLRAVSFVDAPGHETLMATMLSGSAIMDAALLLVAADELCPQPQTKEHLMALQISGIKNIIIVQNKIDLVAEEDALENYKQIKAFVKGSIAENAPIIPISAKNNVNIDLLIQTIEEQFLTPKRDLKKSPIMFIARSFDINKPGVHYTNIVGHPVHLPEVYLELQLVPHLLDRVVGSEKELQVEPIKKGENLMLNVNSSTTVGLVTDLSKNYFTVKLKLPVCAEKTDKITVSRLVGHRFRLIGYCTIK